MEGRGGRGGREGGGGWRKGWEVELEGGEVGDGEGLWINQQAV